MKHIVECSFSFENEFFVIDSINLDSVNQKFYGYGFQDNTIVFNHNINYNVDLDYNGAYIWVKVTNNTINILQDFNGSYGLYLYQNENYFAISNSFLKLVEYLKDKFELSLNQDYADAFLFADLCSFSYGETLINEIEVLPRNYEIIINKLDKSLDFNIIDYEEGTVDINSLDCLNILDDWFNKYIGLLRSIKKETNNLSVDLSGGFDSRIVFSLFLASNVDFNKIRVNSSTSPSHKEDFDIALEISKEFNFKLNNQHGSSEIERFTDLKTPIDISFYPKLGFHKQMYFAYEKSSHPQYVFRGQGGECIRGYYNLKSDEFVSKFKNHVRFYSNSLEKSTDSIIRSSINKLNQVYGPFDNESYELANTHYKEVRSRNHFGKSSVESFLANEININPLMDYNLRKLKLSNPECQDENLLIALIFCRYCPKLLDFKFEGGRNIDNYTIEYAKKINNKSPFSHSNFDFISGPLSSKRIVHNKKNAIEYGQFDKFFENIFYSDYFESKFKNYYSFEFYALISRYIENSIHFPLVHFFSFLSILRITECINSKDNYEKNILNWLYGFLNGENINNKKPLINIDLLLLKYNTSRLDIINKGNKNNSIQVIDYSSNVHYTFPCWFKGDNGEGLVVESYNNYLNIKIKCINDGILTLYLRGLDVRDKNNNRFPVFIDFTSLKLNNKEFLDNNKLVSHDNFYIINKNVKHEDIITIEACWLPFNSTSIYKD